MKRRDFIQLSTTLAAGALTPVLAKAEQAQPSQSADIYYTKDSLGRWQGKAATHLPNIEIIRTNGSITVNIVTAHEMKGYEHYIIKHVLLDKNHQFIAEKMFDPMTDKMANSTFNLGSYSGTLYALSLCNKHDLWLHSVDV